MIGWIKLYRKFQSWEWYDNSQMVHLFIHLLLEANHEPKKWQGIVIQRGQMIFGRKKIASELNISQQSLRTCIKRLKSTNEITTKSTNKFTLLTIENYHLYQDSEDESTSKSTSKLTNDQPTTNQQSTTPKEDKKIRSKESNSNIVVEKNKFFPPTQNEVYNYLLTYKPDWDLNLVKNESEKFHDHFTSNGWLISGRSKMKDWKAAVRNWTKNYKKFNNDTKSTRSGERIGRMAKEDIKEFLSTPFKRIDIFSDKGDHQ